MLTHRARRGTSNGSKSLANSISRATECTPPSQSLKRPLVMAHPLICMPLVGVLNSTLPAQNSNRTICQESAGPDVRSPIHAGDIEVIVRGNRAAHSFQLTPVCRTRPYPHKKKFGKIPYAFSPHELSSLGVPRDVRTSPWGISCCHRTRSL